MAGKVGEPTLRGLAFFKKAVALQKRYARAGMTIQNTIQTNGILVDEAWARFFKAHQFLVGISIDGDPALHDHYRKTRNGKGSHQAVIRGLQCLLQHGVEVNVLTVVQRHNGDHGKRVYQYLTSLGGNSSNSSRWWKR